MIRRIPLHPLCRPSCFDGAGGASLRVADNSANVLARLVVAIGVISILLLLASWAFHWPFELKVAAAERLPAAARLDTTPLSREARLTSSFASVVEKIAPQVVYVYSTRTLRRPAMPEMFPFGDDLLRRFFGDRFESDPHQQPRRYRQHGLGSGVIVTEDGYILTNNHVVEGADEIKVTQANSNREFTAKVVGRDAKTDIAVLKIEADELPFATLADSNNLKVGDVVLAVGNPFGVGQTVTMGIISATRRGGVGIGYYEDFIQTDAAINPGNSGGALVDTEGRVIGINTAILSRSGGNQGVGFAVPINLAKSVMDQLIEKGHVVRGYLGVSIQSLTPELAKEFEVPGGKGALIGGVTEGGAAAQAGLKSGDVVTEFAGKPIADSRELMLLVGSLAPGDKAKVKIVRDGREQTLQVTLEQMPQETLASGDGDETDQGDALSGVTVSDISATARAQLNLPADLRGALVTDVDPDSAAYEAGVRPGDVLQQIDHQDVTNAAEAMSVSRKAKDSQILVRLWSRGGSRFVVIEERITQ